MRFIGVLFGMASLPLPNKEYYLLVSSWDGVDTQLGEFMSKNVFKITLECSKLP